MQQVCYIVYAKLKKSPDPSLHFLKSTQKGLVSALQMMKTYCVVQPAHGMDSNRRASQEAQLNAPKQLIHTDDIWSQQQVAA